MYKKKNKQMCVLCASFLHNFYFHFDQIIAMIDDSSFSQVCGDRILGGIIAVELIYADWIR